MKDVKIRVLRLSGCGWCEEITNRLDSLGIKFESLDANEEDYLADRLESLLDTLMYPIIIVDRPVDTWYIFRPSHQKELNKIFSIGPSDYKVGRNTIADMVDTVVELTK